MLIKLPESDSENNIRETTIEVPEKNNGFEAPEKIAATEFTLSYIIERDFSKIELISNLEEKLSSQEALQKNHCDFLTSAGFFGENGKHLGLFQIGNNTIQDVSSSNLLNGYLYINNSEKAIISKELPKIIDPKFALQSGPILMANKLPLDVVSENDETARRVIAATTEKEEIAFIVLYYKPSPLIGPKLSEVPKLLLNIRNTTNLKIIDAINLDGGTHSSFLGETVKLTEISTPGSYFCIKP